MFSLSTEQFKYQSFVNISVECSVTDIDLCSDNETQLISFASPMSPSQGNWSNTQSNHTDMINGVLGLGSSGIYIISRGELAISIAVLWVNSSPALTSAWLCCIVLNSWFIKGFDDDDWWSGQIMNLQWMCIKAKMTRRKTWITIINMYRCNLNFILSVNTKGKFCSFCLWTQANMHLWTNAMTWR